MSRFVWVLLLLLPLLALPASTAQQSHQHEMIQPLQTWNADSLVWSTVVIWTERSAGITLTSGVLIDKDRRRILAARHALQEVNPDGSPAGMIEKIYVVWPSASSDGSGVVTGSDHYFIQRRSTTPVPARLIAQDPSRDLALLEAGTPPPSQARAISLYLGRVEPGTKVLGVAQPFSRASLWFPFSATVTSLEVRRLSYSQGGSPVALYLARGEQNVEFGYSGSPLVLPHSGQLVGMLLAAQVNQPFSFALISSQEIHRFLGIE